MLRLAPSSVLEPPKEGEGPRQLTRRRPVHPARAIGELLRRAAPAQDDKRGSVVSAFQLRAKTWNWLVHSE
jgi:hypothetical protein